MCALFECLLSVQLFMSVSCRKRYFPPLHSNLKIRFIANTRLKSISFYLSRFPSIYLFILLIFRYSCQNSILRSVRMKVCTVKMVCYCSTLRCQSFFFTPHLMPLCSYSIIINNLFITMQSWKADSITVTTIIHLFIWQFNTCKHLSLQLNNMKSLSLE